MNVPLAQESPASDAALLQRYVEHDDREAIGALFTRHMDMAYRVARRMSANSADAEDAVQIAFTGILRHARQFRGDSNVKAWLMSIVVRACRNKAREESRRANREDRVVMSRETCEKDAPDPELQQAVRGAVMQLPVHYRLPIWLHYYEGFSPDEVAVALERPKGTIRKQLTRGTDILRSSLAASGCTVSAQMLTELFARVPADLAPEQLASAIRKLADSPVLEGSSPSISRTPKSPSLPGVPSSLNGWHGLALAVALGGVALLAARSSGPNPAAPIASATFPLDAGGRLNDDEVWVHRGGLPLEGETEGASMALKADNANSVELANKAIGSTMRLRVPWDLSRGPLSFKATARIPEARGVFCVLLMKLTDRPDNFEENGSLNYPALEIRYRSPPVVPFTRLDVSDKSAQDEERDNGLGRELAATFPMQPGDHVFEIALSQSEAAVRVDGKCVYKGAYARPFRYAWPVLCASVHAQEQRADKAVVFENVVMASLRDLSDYELNR